MIEDDNHLGKNTLSESSILELCDQASDVALDRFEIADQWNHKAERSPRIRLRSSFQFVIALDHAFAMPHWSAREMGQTDSSSTLQKNLDIPR
jgi:hypothetical protein